MYKMCKASDSENKPGNNKNFLKIRQQLIPKSKYKWNKFIDVDTKCDANEGCYFWYVCALIKEEKQEL